MDSLMLKILFVLVVLISNIIQTITGFAGTMLAMPFGILLIGIEQAKVILNIMGLLTCVWIVIQNYKSINYKEFAKITIIMSLGIFMGIYIMKIFPFNYLLVIYGLFICLIAIKKLLIEKETLLPRWSMVLLILLAGVIHGMFISGGALLVIYATNVFKDKNEFRATLSSIWVLLNTLLMVNHIINGYINKNTVGLTLICIIPLMCAIILGNYLYKRINRRAFLKLTYILLLVAGLVILI